MSARPIPSEPHYPDRTHPIYHALPIADALDVLDARYGASDLSDAALAAEALLIDAGEAAGGLSTSGFRADLISHVQGLERDEDHAQHDRMCEASGWGGWTRPTEMTRAAYGVGWDAAAQWIADVSATLARHGVRFDGREVVGVMRRAA